MIDYNSFLRPLHDEEELCDRRFNAGGTQPTTGFVMNYRSAAGLILQYYVSAHVVRDLKVFV
jgi:hypothetical protein